MEITRPTVMEIDITAFENNLQSIQACVGKQVVIMPVMKANAYGTWLNQTNVIHQFSIIAVATVDEAIELRKQGFENEIFILNQPDIEEIHKIVDYQITVGISSDSFLEQLGQFGKKVSVHIEIGTGMGRTGIHPNRVQEYINHIQQYPHITIEGIYTHLSSADTDIAYTQKQLQLFNKAVETAEQLVGKLKYIHAAASNGILNFKESHYHLVRPGMILYGYPAAEDTLQKIPLKPVSRLKSKVILLKKVPKGTSIGYARSFITQKETTVATIPMGYADGLRRSLSNKGYVVIKGKKAPIIGNICMDSFMVDVTDIEGVSVGDDVYIWDNEIITLEEVAKLCDTINYEILSTISYRVPRVFVS